jgi:curved DNA-binding protein CbpA
VSRVPDHYRVLQVDPEADAEIVTAAFRVLARRLHPDRDPTGVHEVRMAELNRAYAVVRDPERRRQYDAERRLMQPMGPGDEPDGAARTGGLAARWNAAAAGVPGHPVAEGTAARLSFGRYAGMTLREVAALDPTYLRWLSGHAAGLRYRREIEAILAPDGDGGTTTRAPG